MNWWKTNVETHWHEQTLLQTRQNLLVITCFLVQKTWIIMHFKHFQRSILAHMPKAPWLWHLGRRFACLSTIEANELIIDSLDVFKRLVLVMLPHRYFPMNLQGTEKKSRYLFHLRLGMATPSLIHQQQNSAIDIQACMARTSSHHSIQGFFPCIPWPFKKLRKKFGMEQDIKTRWIPNKPI